MKISNTTTSNEFAIQKNTPFFQMIPILSDDLSLELYSLYATISLYDVTYCILQPLNFAEVQVFTLLKEYTNTDIIHHYIPLENPLQKQFILSLYKKVIASKKNFYTSYNDSNKINNKHVLVDTITVCKAKYDLISKISPLGNISLSFYKRCFTLFPKLTKLHTHQKIYSKTVNDNLFSTLAMNYTLNECALNKNGLPLVLN